MNKIILIIAFIVSSLLCTAQEIKRNTLYVALQPQDLGCGLRYDYRLNGIIGLYGSATHGNYYYNGGYIKNHNKFSIGTIVYLPLEKNNNSEKFISIGISDHKYGKFTDSLNQIDQQAFNPVSIDLGLGVIFNEKFTFGFRWDVFKRESTIDLGWNF